MPGAPFLDSLVKEKCLCFSLLMPRQEVSSWTPSKNACVAGLP